MIELQPKPGITPGTRLDFQCCQVRSMFYLTDGAVTILPLMVR
jgi:hypothetical protein